MSLSSEQSEIEGVVTRLLDNLAASVALGGSVGADLRQQIGLVRSRYLIMLYDGDFASELLHVFTTARSAGINLNSLYHVHQQLFLEEPEGEITDAIVQLAIVLCMSTESRMISQLEFVSRDDVEVMQKKMKMAFDTARELAADAASSESYRNLTFLAGALTNHLSTISRPLPRMVTFSMSKSLPALTLSQRLYYTAERWSEIVDENKTVHPAFPQREIMGLSR